MKTPEPLVKHAGGLHKQAIAYRKAAAKAAEPRLCDTERDALKREAHEKALLAFQSLATCTAEARADLLRLNLWSRRG